MKVIAAAGLQVPMADNPRRYVTDALAVDVPDDTYYHRRIADGDLELVTDGDLIVDDAVEEPAQIVATGDEAAPLVDGAKPARKSKATGAE